MSLTTMLEYTDLPMTQPNMETTAAYLQLHTEQFLCGDENQVISSPGYPNQYGNNQNINWTFTTHVGSLLSVEFYDFYLEGCCDYVTIYSDGDMIGRFSGSSTPPKTISTNNTITVVFSTDGSVVEKGFKAEVSVYPEGQDGECSNFNEGFSDWANVGPNKWYRSSQRYVSYEDLGSRYSGSDYYINVRCSYGESGNKHGYLSNHNIPESWNQACLRFNYYMSGYSSQQIDIYHYFNYYDSEILFRDYDDFSQKWKSKSIDFISNNSSLTIYGRANGGYYDTEMVAIDDIYISKGACSEYPDILQTTASPERSTQYLTTFEEIRTTEISPTTASPTTQLIVTTPEWIQTDVVCSNSYMTVYLDAASLESNSTAHFIDPMCGTMGYTYRNGMYWLYLYTRYDQCQTTMKSTLASTTYKNQVIVSNEGVSTIYRKDDSRITVECDLKNTGHSSVSFDTLGTEKDYLKREHDNFTFAMELYTDSSYSTPYPSWQYPITLELGSKVFVGASVKTFSNDMVLFVDSCKATPNPDPDAQPNYDIIKNSCDTDSTVSFDGKSTDGDFSRAFFSFETFGFNGEHSTIFVHCQLSICNESDWRCSRNCNQRQRRDVTLPNKLSDSISIELGPLVLKSQDASSNILLDAKESTSTDEFQSFPSILLIALSLVVMAIGCSLWVMGRKNDKTSYQKLENHVEEM
ncbi:scavenger receptor cysteine-rich domain-containing protein DMBT1-like [Antedon mediterranea]|uniref:scavenger receptor cysteine-rich domain-containing protein DMBT1-like n=1 Tax=Antedon mediterranea TaxID=105859 RepID=UPI003AF6BAB8